MAIERRQGGFSLLEAIVALTIMATCLLALYAWLSTSTFALGRARDSALALQDARVAQAIVERQRHFFEHGEVAMRPLVLREIADILGLHESTVSRVTSQKYMATPRGIFELKYFFGSHVATDSGGACSATAIRALIKQLIAAEDGKKPLSDSQLSEILGQQGIVVARRTVAKYRESLNIPPVNLRKTL